MATSGLGGFLYDTTVKDGSVSFHWYDPEDATNTADSSASTKDFPEGVTSPDARQVADLAYLQVSKTLNDKRDARIKKEAADQLDKQVSDDAARREAAAEFFGNSTEQADTVSALNTTEDASKKK